ncbi:MAG: hypothetical protein HYV14_12850 [Elusimicrobia bacterium]|nr:hypothetical protein [Elusimicrobiota bacterium]
MNDDESTALETAKQLGIPYASHANRILVMQRDQGLKAMVPEVFAREDLVLPLFIDGKVLAVAMADPTDRALIARLERDSGLDVQPFIATKKELTLAIDESYA